jgi:hypothetical protein
MNEFCVPGRFWTTIPTREYGEEERAALLELLELEAAEDEIDQEEA